jgi:predicted MFS family arabinose efflux permease
MTDSVVGEARTGVATWGRNLVVLAITVFLVSLGTGLLGGVSTNFMVDELGLSGKQVLWNAGIREIPGLALMGIAALIMHWPLSRRAALSLALMGVGYVLYATVHSFTGLIAVALISSLGFHNWLPLQSSLGLALSKKQESGRVLGTLTSMGSLAMIAGMGLTALLATRLPLRAFYIVGGIAIVAAGLLVSRIPPSVGERTASQPRFLLKKRYWLYYVLILFEGSRMQVFHAFGTLILVQVYGWSARQISVLLVISGVVNFLLVPRLGQLLDVLGERLTLAVSYVLLALCFVGYATVQNPWFMGGMLVVINLLVTLRIGLATYVRRIAPPDEITPTLSAGVSINHITSVSMSLLAGSLLEVVGYQALCWGAAVVIMLSVPFAMAIRVMAPERVGVQPSGAE